MAISPSSPLTGGAVSGLTSPTYTLASDIAPSVYGKQWIVTALGGTQTGVDVHSVAKPFTITVFRPQAPRALPAANPVTGLVRAVPHNLYTVKVRKGALPLANQSCAIASIDVKIDVPAGTETNEPEELKAMLSCLVGFLTDQANGLVTAMTTGSI